MPYSAVIQPRAWPLSQGGSRSSRVAVTSTWVSPNFTKQEPSAYFTTPRSSDTARNSSGCRRLGRIAGLLLGVASVPIPKFASFCGTLVCELRNRRTLSIIDPVWLWFRSPHLRFLAISFVPSSTCVFQRKPENARIYLHRPGQL